MTGALYAMGIPLQEGLALAVLTHGLRFAYSYTVAAAFTLGILALLSIPHLRPPFTPTFRSPTPGRLPVCRASPVGDGESCWCRF